MFAPEGVSTTPCPLHTFEPPMTTKHPDTVRMNNLETIASSSGKVSISLSRGLGYVWSPQAFVGETQWSYSCPGPLRRSLDQFVQIYGSRFSQRIAAAGSALEGLRPGDAHVTGAHVRCRRCGEMADLSFTYATAAIEPDDTPLETGEGDARG